MTRRLEDAPGWDTRLFRGTESEREGNMDGLAAELAVKPVAIPTMRRDVGPRDLPALLHLARELRRYRPDVVHTEAAKAGTLGRAAALIAFPRRRPAIVHTFHGHSLEGYFSPRRARFFLTVERFLARRTDVVIAVSEEVKDDLVRLGVTTPDRVRVVPLGLELRPFGAAPDVRARKRSEKRMEWGLPDGAGVVTLVARLAPIKRVDRFLRIARLLHERDPELRFVVVGDGELHDELRASADAAALGDRLRWSGFERDMPAVCFASDCVVLTSDNEGTPVSLIEAEAAGVPTVSTRVGGAPSVAARLLDPDDESGFAEAVLAALEADPGATTDVAARYSLDRLVGDLTGIYDSLVAAQTRRHSSRSA